GSERCPAQTLIDRPSIPQTQPAGHGLKYSKNLGREFPQTSYNRIREQKGPGGSSCRAFPFGKFSDFRQIQQSKHVESIIRR
ncbi:MAG TPA: hypothetical protein VE178_16910, partial [Silvibacterium sp.]|nr:hypothetical protein [Silvibacterium sp.]